MEPRKLNPSPGEKLKELRVRLGLSMRDVEAKSQQVAEERQSREYYVSHAWVTDIENGKFTPSIYKFHTFSAIYNRRVTELISYFGLRSATLVAIAHPLEFRKRIFLTAEPTPMPTRCLCQFSSGQSFGSRGLIC